MFLSRSWLMQLSVQQLRARLEEHDIEWADCCTKKDYVEKILRIEKRKEKVNKITMSFNPRTLSPGIETLPADQVPEMLDADAFFAPFWNPPRGSLAAPRPNCHYGACWRRPHPALSLPTSEDDPTHGDC